MLGLFAFSFVAQGAEPGRVIVLKAARLFDGKGKALVSNGVVIVQGNKIVDAGSNLPVPDGAEQVPTPYTEQKPKNTDRQNTVREVDDKIKDGESFLEIHEDDKS